MFDVSVACFHIKSLNVYIVLLSLLQFFVVDFIKWVIEVTVLVPNPFPEEGIASLLTQLLPCPLLDHVTGFSFGNRSVFGFW